MDVCEAFENLADSMPEGFDCLDELTSFLEHTYIRGRKLRVRSSSYASALFQSELWNKYEAGAVGVARKTNAVEGWHHALQFCNRCLHVITQRFGRS